jgi:hypothetical protein
MGHVAPQNFYSIYLLRLPHLRSLSPTSEHKPFLSLNYIVHNTDLGAAESSSASAWYSSPDGAA